MFENETVQKFAKKRPMCLMAQMALARMLNPQTLDQLFDDHAQRQYSQQILFSALVSMMVEVALRIAPSVNKAYEQNQKSLNASLTAVYNKLPGIEPAVMQALVRYSYQHLRVLTDQSRAKLSQDVPGYSTKILDGNHLSGSEHRVQELRQESAAALPGKSLVVLDPQLQAVADMFPIEDGHAQERSILDQVRETIQERDLWIGDRNFCTSEFLIAIHERQAAFVIRWHSSLKRPVEQRQYVGSTETGEVYQSWMTLKSPQGEAIQVRRIEIQLNKPTRDGSKELVILTNLPEDQASALKVSEIYRDRWKIETAFNHLTTVLRCEVETLGYPKAALFSFAIACVAYNAIMMSEWAVRVEHGIEQEDILSKYSIVLEIKQCSEGLRLVLEDLDFRPLVEMSVEDFVHRMLEIARGVDLNRYKKSKRGPKKKVQKKPHNKDRPHVSTYRILKGRHGASP